MMLCVVEDLLGGSDFHIVSLFRRYERRVFRISVVKKLRREK